jgi:hypothetical protein
MEGVELMKKRHNRYVPMNVYKDVFTGKMSKWTLITPEESKEIELE